MQTQKANWVQYTTGVLALIVVVGLFVGWFLPTYPTPPTASEIASELPSVSVPTASEIASLVEVPKLRNDNFDDILEGVYPNEVREIQRGCIRDLQNEFDDDDVLDDVQNLIENFEGEEIDELEITDFNFDNDFDFNVLNLGLDDDEDRAAEITSTLRVEYVFEDGNDDVQRDKVYAYASCDNYDDEEQEFDDLNVEYSMNDNY